MAEARVNSVPVNCIPSPESPQKRIVTAGTSWLARGPGGLRGVFVSIGSLLAGLAGRRLSDGAPRALSGPPEVEAGVGGGGIGLLVLGLLTAEGWWGVKSPDHPPVEGA
jgi:hypothetical protein